MLIRILSWFLLNVLFAFLPLLIRLGLAWAATNTIIISSECVPDFAFLGVMLSVIATTDIISMGEREKLDKGYTLSGLLLGAGALVSVAVLTAFYSEQQAQHREIVLNNWLRVAEPLALVIVFVSTAVEIALIRIEERLSGK